jgi:hypothetical protein
MLLFPPWGIKARNDWPWARIGYGSVFNPPLFEGPPFGTPPTANMIGWGTLAAQLGAVWVLAGGVFVLLGSDRKPGGSEAGS